MSSTDNEKLDAGSGSGSEVKKDNFYGPIQTAEGDYEPLSDDEISAFFEDVDKDNSGYVDFAELEAKLIAVHEELAPNPMKHHLLHPARRDLEKNVHDKGDGLHSFLESIMPGCERNIPRAEFVERVRRWRIPSQKQTDEKNNDAEDKALEKEIPLGRRVRAYWSVHGPVIAFTSFVVALQIAFGLWQGMIYVYNPQARAALGWGVILAKLCAGVMYPTLFFMLLSMSRHFATFLRRSYYISKFVNWDLSQMFHIRISIAGLFFATLHAIGHLTGSMLTGSQPGREQEVAEYLGPDEVPRPYIRWVRSLPGWTGLTAIITFWIISLLSMPFVRKRSYEMFQLGHLLMFLFIGLLCAHGTAQLLQHPMLGYFLVLPSLLVIGERLWRIMQGFRRIPAKGRVLDEDTAEITCKHPKGKDWRYNAGQYVFLQVPALSFFQWHPFTISSCRGNILQLHIKFDGDWTNKLRELIEQSDGDDIRVGIDGPFGAPAQRFYDYDYSIIVGGGIGITPFSAILTDLEESFTNERKDPWEERRRSRSMSRPGSRRSSMSTGMSRRSSRIHSRRQSRAPSTSDAEAKASGHAAKHPNPDRRVDFHWTVREKNNLLWFSDLLNRAIEGAQPHLQTGTLDLNINTHITAKRKNISTHVFRYLLDTYRTEKAPYSALTGLKGPSHFGRPDFDAILDAHFDDLVKAGVEERKVGVFVSHYSTVREVILLTDCCVNSTAAHPSLARSCRTNATC